MTIVESYRDEVILRQEKGELRLNSYETEFIEYIKNLNKKELRKLTKEQYFLLKKIAEKK